MVIKAFNEFLKDPKKYDSYRILGYAKPTKKTSTETESEKKSPNNYVEREWRKVYPCPTPLKWLNETELEEYRGRKNEKESVGNILKFNISDIEMIIVDKSNLQNRQNYIAYKLGTISDKKISEPDKLSLISKIVVYEEIFQ